MDSAKITISVIKHIKDYCDLILSAPKLYGDSLDAFMSDKYYRASAACSSCRSENCQCT
jgi:hypothetical protein